MILPLNTFSATQKSIETKGLAAPTRTQFRILPRYKNLPSTGFTLIELLIGIGIIAILIAMLLPVMNRARKTSRSVTCMSNLHTLATAFQSFTNSNNHCYPDPTQTQMSWESSLLPYVTPQTFQCPADGELYIAIGSSYDWRDTGSNSTTLAGKMITNASRARIVLVFEALPAWHNPKKINAAMLDGSTAELTYQECLADLKRPIKTPRPKSP